MGLVYAEIELINSLDLGLVQTGYIKKGKVKRLTTRVMVDSGALMMAINESIQKKLKLMEQGSRNVQLADGSVVKVKLVGPLRVKFQDRETTVDALVMPGETTPLLGAIPMEGMDVLIDPARQKLILNPEHPQGALIPMVSFKAFRGK